MIKVEFYSYLHNCHLPIELFIHILHPWPMGSLVLFVLIYQSSVNEKKILFRAMASCSFSGSLVKFFFFSSCSQEKQIFKDRAFTVLIVDAIKQNIALDKCLVNLFVLEGLFRVALPWGHTSPKTKGLRPDSPLAEWLTTRHRGTRGWGLFSECVSLWKDTKWNSYLVCSTWD